MISVTNRVFDYFTTIGVDEKLIETNPNSDEPVLLVDMPLVGLEIIEEELSIVKDTATDKYFDILGNKSLWLRCIHSKDKPAITEIGLFYFKKQGDCIRIKEKNQLKLVSILNSVEERTQDCLVSSSDGWDIWRGRFDLRHLMDAEEKEGFEFAMSYKVQSTRNYDNRIMKLKMITAKTSTNAAQKSNQSRLHVVIPKQYEVIDFSFGLGIKNRIFAYLRETDLQNKRFKPQIYDRYPLQDHLHTSFPEIVSEFCFPEGVNFKRVNDTQPQSFSFVLTMQDGCRIYCTCFIFYEAATQKIIESIGHIKIDEANKLFVQKALCLISHYNYFDEYKQILKHIYRLSLSRNEVPIERYICNIVDDIRLPLDIGQWGKVGIQYEIGAEIVLFQTSNKYPSFSAKSLLTLFRVLDIDKIIFLFECVLLEKKLFIISKYKSVITQVSEALTSLIFPFLWNHVYIPVLPDMFKTYMEAPLPFIIGLEQKKNFNISSGVQSDSIQVYLDSNDLINIEQMPALPEKSLKQLKKRLVVFAKLHLPLANLKAFSEQQDLAFNNEFADDDLVTGNKDFDAYDIRDAFLEFVSSFMLKYRKFLIPPDQKKSNKEMSEIIDLGEFLSFHKSSKQGTFLQKFVETTMFSYFIETRTQISPFLPYYQFFDMCQEMKRTKKEPILFLKENLSKTFFVNQPNTSNLISNQIHMYENFPNLKSEYFCRSSLSEESFKASEYNLVIDLEPQNRELSTFDEYRWGKHIYESIYFLWFEVLNWRVKREFFRTHHSKLLAYAIFLLAQLRKKNHELTEHMYRFVIEACGYYGRDDKVIDLVQSMKEQKIDISPITHGLFFQAVSRSSEFFAQNHDLCMQIFQGSQQPISHQNSVISSPNIAAVSKDGYNSQSNGGSLDKRSSSIINRDSSIVEGEEAKIGIALSNWKLDVGTEQEQKNLKSRFASIVFAVTENCPKCKRTMYPEEIFSNWKRSYEESLTKCPLPSCGHEFTAKFSVVNLEDINPWESKKSYDFLSPLLLRKAIERIMKEEPSEHQQQANNNNNADIQTGIWSNSNEVQSYENSMEKTNPQAFWNLILYLKLIRVPTFFLESDQPSIYYNLHATRLEKKIARSLRTQEKGLLSKMSDYFFKSTNSVGNSQNNVNNSNGTNGAQATTVNAAKKAPHEYNEDDDDDDDEHFNRENDGKTSNSSASHLSPPPQDTSSKGSIGKKDIKDPTLVNFGSRTVKKIFTPLFIKLRRDSDNALLDLESRKSSTFQIEQQISLSQIKSISQSQQKDSPDLQQQLNLLPGQISLPKIHNAIPDLSSQQPITNQMVESSNSNKDIVQRE